MTDGPRKASHTSIIAMLMLGGFVLALGGCGLFLTNEKFFNGGHPGDQLLIVIGACVFIGGALAFIAGALWLIVRWMNRFFTASGTK